MDLETHLTRLREALPDGIDKAALKDLKRDQPATVASAFQYGPYWDEHSTGRIIRQEILRESNYTETLADFGIQIDIEGEHTDTLPVAQRVIVTRIDGDGDGDELPQAAVTFIANPDNLYGVEGLTILADRVYQAVRMAAQLPVAESVDA